MIGASWISLSIIIVATPQARKVTRRHNAKPRRLIQVLQEFLNAYGLDIPGVKRVFYGVCLLVVIMALPHGIWPPLARLLRLDKRQKP